MGLKKILKGLKKVAPVAASVASVTGVLPPGVGKILGVGDHAPDEEIERAVVRADPTQLAELRRVDADLEKTLAENGLKRFVAEAADRDSARKREIAVRDSTPRILAFIVLGGVLGLAYFAVFKQVQSEPLVHLALGGLIAKLGAIFQYYFGAPSEKATDEHQTATT